MISEKDIIFVTTTLYSKWLTYQSQIIKKLFPESEHLIIDGCQNWPNSWFYWIKEIKKSDKKIFIHIDEDFFITNKEELIKAVEILSNKNVDLVGVPDGLHHYRGANPVAINTFLMIGRVDDIKKIELSNIHFGYTNNGWNNNYGLAFKEKYKIDWNYNFPENGGSNFYFEQEPYYAFMWAMKEIGCKFYYLYPSFDERFKSTNPRIQINSADIGIHMWYTRQWNTEMDVHGVPNVERYNKVENYIKFSLNI